MRRIAQTSVFALLMALGLGSAPALAQYDNRALYDRIDRLERDIQVMQQNVSRGAASGARVITSPAAGGGAYDAQPQVAPMSSGLVQRLDDRVDQLEDQMRQLTGKVEEATFKAQQVSKQLERMQADIDLRFKDLQQGGGAAGQPAALGAPAAGGAVPPKANVGGNSAEAPGGAPGPQILGAMPEKDMKKALAGKEPALPPAPTPKDAQGTYDEAYAAAQRGDYAAAEKGFTDFLGRFGSHQLAPNASYWLGDIAYVKKDYGTAAATFLEAYKKYPKHSKAPDMIYKAGSSFGLLGKKKEACTAFAILFKEHADMPDRVKRAATAEKQKYECK
ncbi:MAG: tol-pal system protein YbgF [Solirubrobacterales bacterium]